MKKTMKTITALALCAMAAVTVLSSCNTTKKVPSQEDIETKIIGKWKRISQDGVPVLTNLRAVQSYGNNGKGICSISAQKGSRYVWINKAEMKYSVTSNILYIDLKEAGQVELYESISSISADAFSAHEKRVVVGKEDNEREVTWQRVTTDYSNDIIGMWEGVAITGDETYGDANHRIEYKADGTYEYYSLVNGKWETVEDAFNEYNVDGDWLATRWQEKGSDEMLYEWWDIDYIKGDEMKWSALREKDDGTRFTTTFTWKRVR